MNWHYATNGIQKGPIPTEDMKSRIAMGEIAPTDLAWREGMADWMPVASIAELKVDEPPARVETPASEAPVPSPEPYRAPAQASPVAPGNPLLPPSQGLAIASMICGILCYIGCCAWYLALPLAIAAIVTGHIARSKAKSDPVRYGGKGMARAGLVTGYLGLIGGLIFAIFSLQFVGLTEQERQEKIINWFPPDVQQQMREQLEQRKLPQGP